MLIERLNQVRARIDEAAQRCGRTPGEIRLLAVSKQYSSADIRAVAAAGLRDFGESYAQEAAPKIEALRELELNWHFIGRLQSNKTRLVAEQFAWVHTLDRERIAQRLNDQRPHYAPPLNVCIQVQIGAEAHKGGVHAERLAELARQVGQLPKLRLRGLMCIPPVATSFAEQFAHFEQLAHYARQLRDAGVPLDTLSMGMSADFEAAIAAGSTLVRIGTAIFGARS